MKKLRLLVPVLMLALFLNGCGFVLPYLFLNFSQIPTEDHLEITEELPIGSEVASNLDAEDIYYRCKFAAGGKAFQYSRHATIQLSYEGELLPVTICSDVALDPETVSVNVTEITQVDQQETDRYQLYYRDEDGRLICYSHIESTGECYRDEIPLDGMTSYWIIASYVVYGYPSPVRGPTMEPYTRILDGREVYQLTFYQTALELFGSTGNASYDQKMESRLIPTTWYIDKETYLTVQQSFTITQVDDLLGQAIVNAYQLPMDNEVAIAGYTFTLDNMVFDPVEVSPVPEDVMEKAWESSGFSAN